MTKWQRIFAKRVVVAVELQQRLRHKTNLAPLAKVKISLTLIMARRMGMGDGRQCFFSTSAVTLFFSPVSIPSGTCMYARVTARRPLQQVL